MSLILSIIGVWCLISLALLWCWKRFWDQAEPLVMRRHLGE